MNKKLLLIVGGLLAVCVVGFIAVDAAGGALAIGGTQPAAKVGDSFMTALKSGDYAQAFGLCSPELQNKLQDAKGLQSMIEAGKAQPASWTFNSRNLSNGTAELAGDVTFAGGQTGNVSLVLGKSGSDWRVTGFNLKEK